MKKIIGLILAMCLTVSCSFGIAAYSDIKEGTYESKAIEVLSGLEILNGYEDNTFRPDEPVTRAEMAKIVCLAVNSKDLVTTKAEFADVSEDHWASGYIAFAANSGIVNGIGNNMFAPEAEVKFQDAVVMLSRALGYERIANRAENGGYPTGYLKLASQKGMLTNINYDGAAPATRGVIAELVYNGLTVPMVDVSYYAPNPEDDEYIIYDGKGSKELRTLLTYVNEVYKVKAVIENTPKTDENLRKNSNFKAELTITDTYGYDWEDILEGDFSKSNNVIKPCVGNVDVDSYLGYTVEAYITENNNEDWELLVIVPDSKSTVSETIYENFESYSEGTFEYYADLDDARTTKIDLVNEDKLSVYYNGSLIDSNDIEEFGGLENLLVNVANVITFMGPKNNDYDKIFVTDFSYRQVDSVKVKEEFIKFTSGGISLDKEERNDDNFIYNLYDAEGNVIGLEDIEEDNLLNIVAPLVEGKTEALDEVPYMDIYVTDFTVTGTVTECIKEDKTYIIADEEFDLDKNAKVKVGDEGIFYITIDGLVYTSDAASTASKNYSFIAAYGYETDFGVNTHQLKLFTIDGDLETYDIASTVKIYEGDIYNTYKRNNKSQDEYFVKVADLVADEETADAAKAKLINRLVTYKLNSNDEIIELRFAGSIGDDFYAEEKVCKYNSDTQMFGRYDLDVDSKLFVAPVTEITEGVYNVEEDDIELASFASLDEDKIGGYKVYVYNFEDAEYLGAALSGDKILSTMKKSHLAVVKSHSTGIDEDGYDVDKYTFIQSGNTLTKAVDYDSKVEEMSIGDVFRYTVNAEGEIEEVEVYYDASERTFEAGMWDEKDYDVNDIAIVFGEVTSIRNNKITLNEAETYAMNEVNGATYALIDENKFDSNNPSSAVKALSSADNIKETYGSYTYYVVALYGESGGLEDIVQIQCK